MTKKGQDNLTRFFMGVGVGWFFVKFVIIPFLEERRYRPPESLRVD